MKAQQYNDLCVLAKQITGIDIRYIRARKKEYVQIKAAIVNVMRRYYSATTVQVGRLMNLHHTTVIHHTKDHASRYRFEDDYASLYDKLVRHAMNNSDTLKVDNLLTLMKSALSVPEV